jgi:hypothetical protein
MDLQKLYDYGHQDLKRVAAPRKYGNLLVTSFSPSSSPQHLHKKQVEILFYILGFKRFLSVLM